MEMEELQQEEQATQWRPTLPNLGMAAMGVVSTGIFAGVHNSPIAVVSALATVAAFRCGDQVVNIIRELSSREGREALLTSLQQEQPRGKNASPRLKEERVAVESMLSDNSEKESIASEDDESFGQVNSEMVAYIAKLAQNMRHPYARSHNPKTTMKLAPNFNPDVDDVSGLGILIAAIKGAGKTVLGVRMAEQFSQYYIPMAVFDKEGDILSAVSVFPLGMVAGHPKAARGYAQGQFLSIADEDSAYQVGYDILEHGYQIVFDLRSFANDEERALIMIGVIDGMTAWADERSAEERVPALIILDEAAHWMPEDEKLSKLTTLTLGRLIGAFTETAQAGRKRGLIQVYMCQRISELKKSVMAESDMYIFGRARLDNDLKRYMEYIDSITLGIENDTRYPLKAAKQVISSLGKGDFVVCMPDGTQFVIHAHERNSKHISHTPKADRAMARYGPQSERTVPHPMPREQHGNVQHLSVTQALNALRNTMTPEQLHALAAMTRNAKVTERLADTLEEVDSHPEHLNTSDGQEKAPIPLYRAPGYEQTMSDDEVAEAYGGGYRVQTANLPKQWGTQQQEAECEYPSTPEQPTQHRHSKYQAEMVAWRAGAQTVRDMATAMGYPESRAYQRMQEMDRLGLIQMKKRRKYADE